MTGLAGLLAPPDCIALTPPRGLSLAGFPPELTEAGNLQPVRMAVTMTGVTNKEGALCVG